MPPNGGFGGNTGIHDAHNLAWKLALVRQGRRRSPALLDTYDAERRPVGRFTVEQAYTRYVTRTAPYLGADGPASRFAADLDIELGYVYRSPAITVDEVTTVERRRHRRARRSPRDLRPSGDTRPSRVARLRRTATLDARSVRPTIRAPCRR